MKNWINLNRGKVLLGLAVIVGFIVVMTFATSGDDNVISEAEGGVGTVITNEGGTNDGITDTERGFVTK